VKQVRKLSPVLSVPAGTHVLFPENTQCVSATNSTTSDSATTCLSCAAWVACNSTWRWWPSLRLRELPSVDLCDVLCNLRSDHLSNRHWCRGWLGSRHGVGARCRWRHSCSQKLESLQCCRSLAPFRGQRIRWSHWWMVVSCLIRLNEESITRNSPS